MDDFDPDTQEVQVLVNEELLQRLVELRQENTRLRELEQDHQMLKRLYRGPSEELRKARAALAGVTFATTLDGAQRIAEDALGGSEPDEASGSNGPEAPDAGSGTEAPPGN